MVDIKALIKRCEEILKNSGEILKPNGTIEKTGQIIKINSSRGTKRKDAKIIPWKGRKR